MSNKHTPGPWLARSNGGEFSKNHWHIVADSPHIKGKQQTVCELNGPWKESNYAANAHLIAAAPELLAALQDCITHDGAVAWRNAEMAGRRLEAISNIARAAIQKATKP